MIIVNFLINKNIVTVKYTIMLDTTCALWLLSSSRNGLSNPILVSISILSLHQNFSITAIIKRRYQTGYRIIMEFIDDFFLCTY